MDTFTYTKQDDGSFTKTVTHIETTTLLDNDISVATNLVRSISGDVQALELQLRLKRDALTEAQSRVNSFTAQNDGKVATRKTFTEETPNIYAVDEVAGIETMVANLQVGTTDDADAQAQIDAQIANLQDCLVTLKS